MLAITGKLRMIIALGAVSAAVASSGIASAATVARQPGTVAPVAAAPPTIVAESIDPNKVGGTGEGGYDDAKCEQLAGAYNIQIEGVQSQAADGRFDLAASDLSAATETLQEVNANCFVQD